MSKVKLETLGSFKNGLNFSAEKVSSGCKIIGIPDFKDNYFAPLNNLGEISQDIVSDDYLLTDNDILFVRSNGNKALVGRTMLVIGVKSPITFSGFCIRFRPNLEKVDPLYMLYLFKSPVFRKHFSKTQQTSINNLNQDILGGIEIELPDIDTQRKISSPIHCLTQKIMINNAINDNLAA